MLKLQLQKINTTKIIRQYRQVVSIIRAPFKQQRKISVKISKTGKCYSYIFYSNENFVCETCAYVPVGHRTVRL